MKYPVMIRCFPVFILIFLHGIAAAQVKQEVIASAGTYFASPWISISWTLGETMVPTFSSRDVILTHGFQQHLIVTAIEDNLETLFKISVFPNPSALTITVRLDPPVDDEIKVLLFNTQGIIVKTEFIESTMVEKQINLQDLPSGVYLLKLSRGKLSNIYKVVKL